jgi:branched-chain amino acid transport system substrate-binding protein
MLSVAATRHYRRTAIVSVLLLGIIVLAACGSSGGGSSGSSGSPGASAIKIGVITTLSGPVAPGVAGTLNGAKVAASVINSDGGVLGKKIQVLSADDGFDASKGVAAMRQMSGEGVGLFLSSADTDVCLAQEPLLQQLNAVMITLVCTTTDLTGPGVNPRFFRVSSYNPVLIGALATYVCDNLQGVTRFDEINYNYAVTVDSSKVLATDFAKKCGIKQGTNVLTPSTTGAALPYVNDLLAHVGPNSAQNSVLFLDTIGEQAIDFMKQATATGLFKKYRAVIASLGVWNQIVDSAGSAAPPIAYTSGDYYYAAFNTPANTTFDKAYEAAYNTEPDASALEGYRAMNAMAAAIKKAGSTSPAAVTKALEGLTFSDPSGQITINATTHEANSPDVITEWQGDTVHSGYSVSFASALSGV